MRILKNPNPVETYTVTCKNCSCKFEYTETEIQTRSWNDANGRIGGRHNFSTTTYVECPNCGAEIVLSRLSGYGSSVVGDCMITENYHIENE